MAGTPVDASDLLRLKDPEYFEAHAWKLEQRLKSREGLVRREGPGGRFRENAVVLERGGMWVPYATYEARLITLLPGTPPGASTATDAMLNQSLEDMRVVNAARLADAKNPPPTTRRRTWISMKMFLRRPTTEPPMKTMHRTTTVQGARKSPNRPERRRFAADSPSFTAVEQRQPRNFSHARDGRGARAGARATRAR